MKKTRTVLVALLLAALAFLGAAFTARADDDPPNRVARVNFLQGAVSFEPSGEQDWADAQVNRPMSTGDRLWADKESRAELHLGSTAIRIDENTGISFLELSDQVVQLQLSEGTVLVRLRHLDDNATFEVDAPNAAITFLRQGEYRIDTNEDGNETVVSVISGQAQVNGGGHNYTVVSDQQARFSGTDTLDYSIEDMPAPDAFDDWCFDRDKREDHVTSVRYVSPEVTGYEDLDEYGSWDVVPDYGPVWVPNGVAADWAPYSDGYWSWFGPYGWTWVDYAPWGFAPFHYGRWGFYGSRWFWVPGPFVPHPFWAPALVGWVGGPGIGVGIGVGVGVGWFPLAPGEVFIPGYRVSRAYISKINITNTRVNEVNITRAYNDFNAHGTVTDIHYANMRVEHGVTAMNRDAFVAGKPVRSNLAKVDPRKIEHAAVGPTAAFAPTRESVYGAARPASVKPPEAVANRMVVANRQPPAPRPSFEQQRSQLEKNPGRPLTTNEMSALSSGSKPATPGANNSGFRPFRSPTSSDNGGTEQRNTQWTNPSVRPAPAVQPKTEDQVQKENESFKSWQQHQTQSEPRQQTARTAPAPRTSPGSRPAFSNNHMSRPSGGGKPH